MTRDRAPIFVAFTDLLICLLCYVLIAVSPTKAKVDGVKPPALYLLSIEWDTKLDIDPDIWLIVPKGPIFYLNKQIANVSLDQDNRGWSDDGIGPDGNRVARAREVIAIRGIDSGHYDLGANLYNYRQYPGDPADGAIGLSVHVMVTAMEPSVRTVFESDVALNTVHQTINAASFDMDEKGQITFVSVPLEPITDIYKGKTP